MCRHTAEVGPVPAAAGAAATAAAAAAATAAEVNQRLQHLTATPPADRTMLCLLVLIIISSKQLQLP